MRVPLPAATKRAIKRVAATKLYPRPVTALAPERLYAYMDALWRARELDGAVVEVGTWLGGTAALSYRMLRHTGYEKRYVCIDTFGGFVQEHFDRDVEHGTAADRGNDFAANSKELVSRLLAHWGTPEIELVQGDITTIDDALLPEKVAVSLVDVDLDVPVYEGLRRIYPRLLEGGTILVDDCSESEDWRGPRIAYQRFVSEHELPERYFMGMGVLEK
jgi:O-methyltransferase